jgi:hypothetical protein
MAQAKRIGKSGSGSGARKAGATKGRPRSTSTRSSGAKSSGARRATKSSAPSGSRGRAGGPIAGITRYLGDVKNKSMNGRVRAAASKAKDAVATDGKGLGAVTRKAKGAAVVGVAGLAGLAGLAGGIALDRWNNSYSRTQAFQNRRRGRR